MGSGDEADVIMLQLVVKFNDIASHMFMSQILGRLIQLKYGSDQNRTAELFSQTILGISTYRMHTSYSELYLVWKDLISL